MSILKVGYSWIWCKSSLGIISWDRTPSTLWHSNFWTSRKKMYHILSFLICKLRTNSPEEDWPSTALKTHSYPWDFWKSSCVFLIWRRWRESQVCRLASSFLEVSKSRSRHSCIGRLRLSTLSFLSNVWRRPVINLKVQSSSSQIEDTMKIQLRHLISLPFTPRSWWPITSATPPGSQTNSRHPNFHQTKSQERLMAIISSKAT